MFKVMVTAHPGLPHFQRFLEHPAVCGIRINTAMLDTPTVVDMLRSIKGNSPSLYDKVWVDYKGRQLRAMESDYCDDGLRLRLNHSIAAPLGIPVFFKAGEDGAYLLRIEEGGRVLVFDGAPKYKVNVGESLSIREDGFAITDNVFTPEETKKIQAVNGVGMNRYYLSYVEGREYIDSFRALVGDRCLVYLKIETPKGVEFIKRYRTNRYTSLVAARGDLYVESKQPHDILSALKTIIRRDKRSIAGSRVMLSTVKSSIPECADFSELAWLHDIGYRIVLLCDDVCLREEPLSRAVGAIEAFNKDYR